jgi:hypothetical protein
MDMMSELAEAEKEMNGMKVAMESELVRRKLHNLVQELKGNLYVLCRVRPVLHVSLLIWLSLCHSGTRRFRFLDG